MTFSTIAPATVNLTAYSVEDKGVRIAIGYTHADLTNEKAEELGNYLLAAVEKNRS